MNMPFYIIGFILVLVVGIFINYMFGIKYVEAEKMADRYVAYFLIILVALIGGVWSILGS